MRTPFETEQLTAARVRIYDSPEGNTMRIGFNPVAERYFSLGAVRHFLEQSTDSKVTDSVLSNPNEAPYVSYSLELDPPLRPEKLAELGERLLSGELVSARPSRQPDGIGVYDNRGREVPDSPVDRGITVAQLLPVEMPHLHAVSAA